MKIATWNLERPTKNGRNTVEMIKFLRDLNADILVLTETNDFIDFGNNYNVDHTSILQDKMYKIGERRFSIFSQFPLAEKTKDFETFNKDTALCVHLITSHGELAVYGTIIGVLGNGGIQYKNNLKK